MPTPGIVYRDLVDGPEPTDTFVDAPTIIRRPVHVPTTTHSLQEHIRDDRPEEKAFALADGPTESHMLASADHDDKGAAQINHDSEVKDLGWFEPKEHIPQPLVGGIDNETLWLLVRRFNKQMYHVKETVKPVPGNLDMNVADEDEFSPDKLRATMERLYMTVIIGLIGFVKHVARLRSWRETRRTSVFCAAYFIAWILDVIMPLMFTTLIVLILYTPSRVYLFPPAPLALVNGATGGVQKPKAGILGSLDSSTGAPENHKGEAVELEAVHFVNSIAHIALSSVSGKHPMDDPEEEGGAPHDAVPDPSAMAMSAGNARHSAQGNKKSAAGDKTKVPMETAMWNKMRPLMHILGDTADTWERFGNALAPVPPFPHERAGQRIAAIIAPLLVASLFTTNYMMKEGMTFLIGFGFFGDPITIPVAKWFDRTFPHWRKILELRNNILKGVPTNAQLTITLLRLGEANKAPLPPPPLSDHTPPNERADITDGDLADPSSDMPLGATRSEIDLAASHDPTVAHHVSGSDIHASKDHKHGKKGAKILGLFKSTVRGAVETALGADRLKANVVGSMHAKDRLGVIPDPHDPTNFTGPIQFKGRFQGKKGTIFLSTKATIPCFSFTTDSTIEKIGLKDREDLHPAWTVAVADISEIKKVGGFGWKTKLVIAWALDREIADGMEITDRKGKMWKITAMPRRDELFNRLVAMGGQKWESW